MDCCDATIDKAMGETLPLVTVACAVLVDTDGRILIAERPPSKPYSGFWEFPGGKIAEGESPQAALSRELEEELGVVTCRACFSPYRFIAWSYPDCHVLAPVFMCRTWKGVPYGKEGQRLKWIRPNQKHDLPMLEGNKDVLRELASEALAPHVA